jgi:hypothetical protein
MTSLLFCYGRPLPTRLKLFLVRIFRRTERGRHESMLLDVLTTKKQDCGRTRFLLAYFTRQTGSNLWSRYYREEFLEAGLGAFFIHAGEFLFPCAAFERDRMR